MPVMSRGSASDQIREVLRKYEDLPQFAECALTNVNQQGFDEDTPLHVACRQGTIEDVDVMIAAGADVMKAGDLGNTPMHEAAAFGHSEVVRKLLEAGANPDLANELGKTPRDRAVLSNHQGVLTIIDHWKTR